MPTPLCSICGRGFESKYPRAKYCSPGCKKEAEVRYRKEYYEKHRMKILKEKKQYYQMKRDELRKYFQKKYEENREKTIERVEQYRRKVMKRYRIYIRSITCPKCGKRGQLRHNIEENTRTGNRNIYAVVYHAKSIWEGGKARKIYLGTCYLGPVTE